MSRRSFMERETTGIETQHGKILGEPGAGKHRDNLLVFAMKTFLGLSRTKPFHQSILLKLTSIDSGAPNGSFR